MVYWVNGLVSIPPETLRRCEECQKAVMPDLGSFDVMNRQLLVTEGSRTGYIYIYIYVCVKVYFSEPLYGARSVAETAFWLCPKRYYRGQTFFDQTPNGR